MVEESRVVVRGYDHCCNSFEEYKTAVRAHENETGFKYTSLATDREFSGSLQKPLSGRQIKWYDDQPYVSAGRQVRECSNGKDRNKNSKSRYIERRDKLEELHHVVIKRRTLTQPTKKINCPAQFKAVRALFIRPDVVEGMKALHRKSSSTQCTAVAGNKYQLLAAIKGYLTTASAEDLLERYLFFFPFNSDHYNHAEVLAEQKSLNEGAVKRRRLNYDPHSRLVRSCVATVTAMQTFARLLPRRALKDYDVKLKALLEEMKEAIPAHRRDLIAHQQIGPIHNHQTPEGLCQSQAATEREAGEKAEGKKAAAERAAGESSAAEEAAVIVERAVVENGLVSENSNMVEVRIQMVNGEICSPSPSGIIGKERVIHPQFDHVYYKTNMKIGRDESKSVIKDPSRVIFVYK